MKKINKVLNSLIASVTVLPSLGMVAGISLTSCGGGLYKQLESSMIQEFKDICKIPHPSDQFLYMVPYESNVMALSNYLQRRFHEITGQHVWQDKYGNIWFDVPANDENLDGAPIIGLQAHMDMVFSFDSTKFKEAPDPLTTPIDIVEDVIDGKRVLHSRDYKTSIGADNGMGVAQIMAILKNNKVKHGKLRVIITNCEENAMQGAKMLVGGHTDESGKVYEATNPDVLKGVNYVLNIDGETQGEVVIACSGGVGSHYTKTGKLQSYEQVKTALPYQYKLQLTGLKGGHSGGAVVNKVGNALKLMNELLVSFGVGNVALARVTTPGTLVYNLIPNSCSVVLATNLTEAEITTKWEAVKKAHENHENPWQRFSDLNLATLKIFDNSFEKVIPVNDSAEIINMQNDLMYGVEKWTAPEGTDKFKTSANIGPVTNTITSDSYTYKVSSYSRSDDTTRVDEFYDSNKATAAKYKFSYLCDAKFPPWLKDTNDALRKMTKDAWLNAGVKESEIQMNEIHGGVECAWWAKAMSKEENEAATISYGPRIDDCHQVTETAYLDTIQACLKTTMYILEHAGDLVGPNK